MSRILGHIVLSTQFSFSSTCKTKIVAAGVTRRNTIIWFHPRLEDQLKTFTQLSASSSATQATKILIFKNTKPILVTVCTVTTQDHEIKWTTSHIAIWNKTVPMPFLLTLSWQALTPDTIYAFRLAALVCLQAPFHSTTPTSNIQLYNRWVHILLQDMFQHNDITMYFLVLT